MGKGAWEPVVTIFTPAHKLNLGFMAFLLKDPWLVECGSFINTELTASDTVPCAWMKLISVRHTPASLSLGTPDRTSLPTWGCFKQVTYHQKAWRYKHVAGNGRCSQPESWHRQSVETSPCPASAGRVCRATQLLAAVWMTLEATPVLICGGVGGVPNVL